MELEGGADEHEGQIGAIHRAHAQRRIERAAVEQAHFHQQPAGRRHDRAHRQQRPCLAGHDRREQQGDRQIEFQLDGQGPIDHVERGQPGQIIDQQRVEQHLARRQRHRQLPVMRRQQNGRDIDRHRQEIDRIDAQGPRRQEGQAAVMLQREGDDEAADQEEQRDPQRAGIVPAGARQIGDPGFGPRLNRRRRGGGDRIAAAPIEPAPVIDHDQQRGSAAQLIGEGDLLTHLTRRDRIGVSVAVQACRPPRI